ncbi:serine hydrolase domain-containing protein [Microbacterium gorillae]|uniref:serine hydrolase domain-containing protein n=1 Tax=Microbacterium gorillae TaxID=1231063 RepID=UPI000693A143|nr:serine hydrolase domain-containing protein [Microbacterium gorillae]
MSQLPRPHDGNHGVDLAGVDLFLSTIADAGIELHSFMLVKDGIVASEGWWSPYDAETPHLLYSLSKSFTSVAAGIAEGEGLLQMTDLLSEHLPEAADYGAATIADALRMSVGHLTDPVLDPSAPALPPTTETFSALLSSYAPERAPGEYFTYDQLATFAVAKIVEKVSGVSLLEYLRPRLLDPLGITEAKWAGEAGNLGFTGLYLTTESIAAFGQLLLQGGAWEGVQLIPAGWLRHATTVRMPNDSAHRFPPGQPVEQDSGLGYGYQFWIGDHGYHAGGAYSQLCIVLPHHNAVLAVTASTVFGQPVLDAVWDVLLPTLDAGSPSATEPSVAHHSPLQLAIPAPVAGLTSVARMASRAAAATVAAAVVAVHGDDAPAGWAELVPQAERLTETALAAYAAARTKAEPLSPASTRDVSEVLFHRARPDGPHPAVRFGGLGGTDLPELEAVRLQGDTLVWVLDENEVLVPAGSERWIRTDLPGEPALPIVVRGGWASAGTAEFEVRMIEGPHVGYLELDPAAATFTFVWREPTLVGRGLEGYRV